MSDIVSRNLLVYPYKNESASSGGLSFEANNDGSVTMNGTISGYSSIYLHNQRSFLLPKGTYILSLQTDTWDGKKPQLEIRIYNGSALVRTAAHVDYSTREQEFEITQEDADNFDNANSYSMQIRLFAQGGTYDNTIVFPMIRLASDPDDTWEPYHPPIHVPDVYFRCTSTAGGAKLEVSYGDEFVGKVLTATNGNKTIRRMAGTSGTVTFTVPESGLWTVSGEVDGATYSVQESVVLDYSVALVSGFEYKSWLTAGGVDPTSYSSLADVLADEILVRRLMTIHAAVDYLASFQTVNAGLETVINNDICAKWINLRDYALDTLHANSAIAAVMDEADKYFYGELALTPQVPIMTSNTTPSGVASSKDTYEASFAAFHAFDGETGYSNRYIPADGTDTKWIQYMFTHPICVKEVFIALSDTLSAVKERVNRLEVIGSNDGVSWSSPLGSISTDDITDASNIKIYLANNTQYTYYRVNEYKKISSGIGYYTIQFYAYAPKGCVPVMTSNTAPYGEASASSAPNSSRLAWNAFDRDSVSQWQPNSAFPQTIQYKSANPICVRRVDILPTVSSNNARVKDFKVQGSNDGTNFTDIYSGTCQNANEIQTFKFSNAAYYLYNRISVTSSYDGSNIGIIELQFYGRQLSVSVPVMTSNTAPYGEVIKSSERVNGGPNYAWYAFDKGSGSNWWLPNSTVPAWIGYKNNTPTCVKMFTITNATYSYARRSIAHGKLQGSNDGTNWVDIVNDFGAPSDDSGLTYAIQCNENITAYKYHRIYVTAVATGDDNRPYIAELQFYGLDYSEREFESGTTKKWLYDHGVELVEINYAVMGTTSTAVNDGESIQFNTNPDTYNVIEPTNPIDLSDYKVIRAKVGENFYSSGSEAFFYVGEKVASSGLAVEASSGYAMGNGNLPNNLAVDISSVNSQRYPVIYCQYGSRTQKADLVEWWLE